MNINHYMNLSNSTKAVNNISSYPANAKLSTRNKTGLSGVNWRANRQSYSVTATVNGKTVYLGCSGSLFEAACIRRAFAKPRTQNEN